MFIIHYCITIVTILKNVYSFKIGSYSSPEKRLSKDVFFLPMMSHSLSLYHTCIIFIFIASVHRWKTPIL